MSDRISPGNICAGSRHADTGQQTRAAPLPPGWEQEPDGDREVTGTVCSRTNRGGQNQQARPTAHGSHLHPGPLKTRVRPQSSSGAVGRFGARPRGDPGAWTSLAGPAAGCGPPLTHLQVSCPSDPPSTPTWVTPAILGSSTNASPGPPPHHQYLPYPPSPSSGVSLLSPACPGPEPPHSHGP